MSGGRFMRGLARGLLGVATGLALVAAGLAARNGVAMAAAVPDRSALEAAGLIPPSGGNEAALPAGLPDAIRNALQPRPGMAGGAGVLEGAGTAVLQEGAIDPATYRLGPGDQLLVNFRGKTTVTHRLTVLPEGALYLPDVGPVKVAGLTLDEGRKRVRAEALTILRDVQVDVQLAGLRVFKVAIRGEVKNPGSYAVTAATRVLELIQMAGGATDRAAVRGIQVATAAVSAPMAAKGATAPPAGDQNIDLLPFLLGESDATSNPFLSDGQSVFVPRRSTYVTVAGAVLYPGTYDLPPGGTTVGELIELVKPTADAATGRVQLVYPRSEVNELQGTPAPGEYHSRLHVEGEPPDPMANAMESHSGPLSGFSGTRLAHREQIFVPRASDYRRSDVVRVEGEVSFPGSYAINTSGQANTAGDVITFAGGFTDKAGASRVRLVRPQPPDTLSVAWQQLAQLPTAALTATEVERARARAGNNYRAVLLDLASNDGKERAAFPLQPGDQLFVPRNDGAVEVAGRVRHPGLYPYKPGAGYADYVNAAGGPAQRGDAGKTRLAAGAGDNFLLARDADAPQPGDRLWVPEKPPRSSWATFRDVIVVLSQVATVYLVIDQATK